MMKVAFSFLLLTLSLNLASAETKYTVKKWKTPGGVEYGTWGAKTSKPAPTLFILAGTIDSTLDSPYFRQCGNELSKLGYLCVSIDIPCHGTQTGIGKPSGLGGWSIRARKNDDFVAESNQRLSDVLDHLIKTGISDEKRVAVCGTSRGGFLAVHFAAHDSRVGCAAGFAPVTNLAALSEFRKIKDNSFVKKLSLANQAERLAGRPVWIVIGDQDERVGTQDAFVLASKITAASRSKKLDSRIELQIMPEPRGHTTPCGSSQKAADWIYRQLMGSHSQKNTRSQSKDTQTERHLLLVDDHHVLYRSGTKRIFHPAKLNPSNPVIREDKAWELAIGWTSVTRHKESGKYQLWYQAYGGQRDMRKSHKCVVCYAESDDGIHFTKPNLDIHDFETDRKPWERRFPKTNIVLLGENGYGDRYANSVLFEPSKADKQTRYKMLYTDFSKDENGQEWPAFHAAFSPDGIHWTKSSKNPLNKTAYGGRGFQPPFVDENVYREAYDKRKGFLRKSWRIPFSMSDAADVMYDPVRQTYAAYGKAWIQGPAGRLAWKHAMARVDSKDFLHWSKPQIVATPDDLDPSNTEFHTSPVFYYQGCYFCLNQILSARGETIGAKADAMHIELMISRDGIHWDRPFRTQKFIAGNEQSFSNGGIFTNSTPVFHDDEIRFYYGGYNSGAIGGGKKLTDPNQQSGVGFASIPVDRFAGIRPVSLSAQSTLKKPLENIGQITLKPLSLAGFKEITLNGDATGGSIQVELLDEDGYRVSGFSKDEAKPIIGDSLSHRVIWQKNKIAQLPPGNYSLRLHLDNAEAFAVSMK